VYRAACSPLNGTVQPSLPRRRRHEERTFAKGLADGAESMLRAPAEPVVVFRHT
jgi:hypothetical protein